MIEIKPASFEDLDEVNRLVARSKSHWPYDSDYLKAALPLLTVDRDWLEQGRGITLRKNGELIGFMGLESTPNGFWLEHLWIEPTEIGKGWGRILMDELKALARAEAIPEVKFLPDPPAEGFYLKCGARFTGLRVASRVPSGPEFREMIWAP